MLSLRAQEGAESMVSRLGGLTEGVDRDIAAFDALQVGVQQDTVATQNLLLRGQAAQQVASAVLEHRGLGVSRRTGLWSWLHVLC